MKNKIIGIIPARMAASRFPGKPLKLIKGFGLNAFFYVDQNDDISPLHGYIA